MSLKGAFEVQMLWLYVCILWWVWTAEATDLELVAVSRRPAAYLWKLHNLLCDIVAMILLAI